jgi:hypothetical protein
MAKQNKTTLKNYFQTGDIPSQAQYAHLIDSQLNLAETGTQIASGNISASNFIAQNDVTASGNISSSGEIIASKVNVITDGSPTADGYYINSTQFISGSTVGTLEFGDFDSDGTRIKITDNSNRIELSNDNPNTTKIFLDGEITASGNISSSGNVIANTGKSAPAPAPVVEEAPDPVVEEAPAPVTKKKKKDRREEVEREWEEAMPGVVVVQ